MNAAKAARTRARQRIPWDLVPLGILAVGLGIVLGQRALFSAQRYATEAPWLGPVILILVGAAAAGGATLLLRKRMFARLVAMRQRKAWLAQIHTLEGLRAFTPTAFELAVAELLRDLGYLRVAHTGGSGDLCADLACFTPRGQRVVVQCKRYGAKKLVGSPEIQQFLGMMAIHHRAERGLYVTTSRYTRHALALAEAHSPMLELIDGEYLARLMQSVR